MILNRKTMHVGKTVMSAASMLLMSVSMSFAGYKRMVVCEEITGTWCAYCPSGIVAMDRVSQKYPDRFIPIAVHYNDVMAEKDYADRIVNRLGKAGAPYAYVMRTRKWSGSVNDLDTRVEYLTFSQAPAMISATAVTEGAVISVDGYVESEIPLEKGQWSIELILTEDNVHHPGDRRYDQKNGYSGSELPMGGFEMLPDVVPSADMHYNDVARLAVTLDSDELPQSGDRITFECEVSVPANVDDLWNCNLTALLLDASGNITNACRCKVNAPSHILEENVQETCPAAYYDVAGRKVNHQAKGLIIEVQSDGTTHKLFRK